MEAEVSYLGADRADGKGVPGHGPDRFDPHLFPRFFVDGFLAFLLANGLGASPWNGKKTWHESPIVSSKWLFQRLPGVGQCYILAIPKITKQT